MRCQASGCDTELQQLPGGRRRYCSDACRQRAARDRLAALTEKRCADCKQVKPIGDFHAPYQLYCRDCLNAKNRARYATGKSYIGRDNSYRKNLALRYGITLAQYDAMAEAQDGRCAICGEQPEKRLRVDHDHATGVIRELLCNHCNVALAQARDNPDLLRAMIAYLERHQTGA